LDAEQEYHHYFMMVLADDLQTVRIIDYKFGFTLRNISYFGHHEAEVTHLATSNGFLYVLRGAVKTIDVYRVFECRGGEDCTPLFHINADTLKPLKVQYFAPQQLITDVNHP
jgi:hypothetical protein